MASEVSLRDETGEYCLLDERCVSAGHRELPRRTLPSHPGPPGIPASAFPHTEVQHSGDVAIVWSSYVVETEVDGRRSSSSSRVTEIFVETGLKQ